ncbi:MAG: hypothetical protein GY826_21900, partial [Fuerstiella sp.]|nr:hypothetical protein [Fuerstiella sp.]
PVARIPKTTSGKVQRAKLLDAYFDGEFDEVLNELHPEVSVVESTDDDPLVAELSRKWGEQALQNIPDTGTTGVKQRIAWMYLSGFGRRPTVEESQAAAAFLMSQSIEHDVTTEETDLWADFAHVLINAKEFIFLR